MKFIICIFAIILVSGFIFTRMKNNSFMKKEPDTKKNTKNYLITDTRDYIHYNTDRSKWSRIHDTPLIECIKKNCDTDNFYTCRKFVNCRLFPIAFGKTCQTDREEMIRLFYKLYIGEYNRDYVNVCYCDHIEYF